MSRTHANRRLRERLDVPSNKHLAVVRAALKTRGIRVSQYCTSHIFLWDGQRGKAIIDHKRHRLVTIFRV